MNAIDPDHCLLTTPALASAGRAVTAKEPITVVREVRGRVSVPCRVAQPAEPACAASAIELDAGLLDLLRALLVAREERKAVEVELRAAVSACQ